MARWFLASLAACLGAMACSPNGTGGTTGAELCASPAALGDLRAALLAELTQQYPDFAEEISIAATAVVDLRDIRLAEEYPGQEAVRCLADVTVAGGTPSPLTYVIDADGVSLLTEYAVLAPNSDEARMLLDRAASAVPALAEQVQQANDTEADEPGFSAQIRALIERERGLNSTCRGSSEQSERACEERNALGEELYRLGMCYGREGESGYQATWHRCTPISCRPDGCGRSEAPAPPDMASEPLAAAEPVASLDAPIREDRVEYQGPSRPRPQRTPSPTTAINSFTRQASEHWSLAGCDMAPLRLPPIRVLVSIDRSGRLISAPRLQNTHEDPSWRALANAAIVAVNDASPFETPSGFTDANLELTFDPGQACPRR